MPRDAKGRFCKREHAQYYRIGDTVQRCGKGGAVAHGTLGTVKNVWDSGIEVEWMGYGPEDYNISFALDRIRQTGFAEPRKPATKPEPTIAPGSVVRLKSGGPEMTVTAVDVAGLKGCTGFTYHHNGKIITSCCPTACLEVVR